MCIPEFSSQSTNPFFTAACSVYTAVCTAAAAIWMFIASLVEKVQKVTAPFFSPQDSAINGTVGKKLVAANIKILFVNGVGTTHEACRRMASSISRIFSDSYVHYTYMPLRYDQVIRTIMFGHRPSACDLLLANIRERLHELADAPRAPSDTDRRIAVASSRALEQPQKLILFVHSGGGAMLEAIREELTADERRQMEVYSLGSAHLFSPAEGFDTVKNAVAGGDPVPAMCRLVDRRVYPLGDAWNVGQWALFNIANHSLLSDIYQLAIWQIRENYAQLL